MIPLWAPAAHVLSYLTVAAVAYDAFRGPDRTTADALAKAQICGFAALVVTAGLFTIRSWGVAHL